MRAGALLPVLLVLCLGCDDKSNPPEAAKPPAENKPEQGAPDTKEPEPSDTALPEAEPGSEAASAPRAEVGKPAPAFELTDLKGQTHALADHQGKVVVLEWFNPGCPFVKYAHEEGPLKDMAAQEIEKGVVWLAINSGGEGRQGHGVQANTEAAKAFGMQHPVLLDPEGTVGHAYGAVKTPHMYVIDEQGILRYMGAIDNAPFGKVEGGGEQSNYVAAALSSLREGKDVETPETDSYGCTVKYAK